VKGQKIGWALALVAAGCGAANTACAPVPRSVQTTELEWQIARTRLAALRATEPKRAYGSVVRVTLREPRTGRSFAARGALAIDPHRAVRMILLGPGGATAMDAWVTPAAYRFEVPAIGLLRRGGARADPGLPVEFFRWWFLAPFEGRLLASFGGAALAEQGILLCEGRLFLLHGDVPPLAGSTVSLCDTSPATDGSLELAAVRRGAGAIDHVSFRGRSDLRAGDRATYEEAHSGVRVEVEVETPDAEPPDPLAFQDPDLASAR
jgi:hypothetical protein